MPEKKNSIKLQYRLVYYDILNSLTVRKNDVFIIESSSVISGGNDSNEPTLVI